MGSIVVGVGSVAVGVGSVAVGVGSVVQCSEQAGLFLGVGLDSVVQCSEQARHDVGAGYVVQCSEQTWLYIGVGSVVQCSEQTGLYGGLGPVLESAVNNQLRAGSIHVGSAVEYSDRGQEGVPRTNGFCLLQRMQSETQGCLTLVYARAIRSHGCNLPCQSL